MKTVTILATSVLLSFFASADELVAAPEQRSLPGTSNVTMKSIEARVTSVDKDHRRVELLLPEGKKVEIVAGPEVRNFYQIRVGDQVTAEYYQKVSVFVRPPTVGEPTKIESRTERAPLGERPAASSAISVESRAVVEAVDHGKREVTLKGPSGKVESFKVAEDVSRFGNVRKGDELVIQATESVAVSVRQVAG
jgi:hypothetical protein